MKGTREETINSHFVKDKKWDYNLEMLLLF